MSSRNRRAQGKNTSGTGRAAHADAAPPSTSRWAKGVSGNPSGRPRKSSRLDGWQNLATALGTRGDKRSFGQIRLDVVTNQIARQLWRGNDVCKRMVELVPDEAIRRGFKVKSEDREIAEAIESRLEAIPGPAHIGRGAARMIAHAMKYQSAYGGAAIFPVINDAAGSLAAPLDKKRIRRVERYQLFEPLELMPLRYYRDPMHPKFGEAELWQLRPLSGNQSAGYVTIHESRLVIFPGMRVTRQQLPGVAPGWGDSIFTPILAPINDFELVYGNAAALIQDFAQAVIKLEDLASVVGTSPQDAHDRLEFMEMCRSSLHALLLDKNDSFERSSTPLTGLDAIMDRMANRVAMARGIPVSILLGQAPAGLNATGDSDVRSYYSTVDIERSQVTPMLEQLIELEYLSSEGPARGKEPDDWSAEWPALWTPTEKEQSETRLNHATADEKGVQNGWLTPIEVRSHWRGDTYSADIALDHEAWDAQEALASDFAETAKATAQQGAPEPDAEDITEGDEPPVKQKAARGKA